ncbi:N-acetylmuramoyl-L-alanine amidase [Bacillus manliponensis]|uniref:N-acetylmuramoyl-L-alanine amidase n=1 Tax=Bacillus manliponensis TaxID=574376 RepID=UPI00068C2AFA|nr:N-acetylmuramoyl-L-alanine amidase [Bacillus manliponensis]
MVKVWIDAGHGGYDSGGVGNGLREKDIVLSIAKEMKRVLESDYGITVGMTRESDVFVSLSQRAVNANNWGADVFVSIHINSGGGNGFETYRMQGVNDSKTTGLQNAVHDAVITFMGSSVRDRGEKQANFAVLRETNMPAILTENLFIDNVEITKFNDTSFLNGVSRAHADGIAQYFGLKRNETWTNENNPYDGSYGTIEAVGGGVNTYTSPYADGQYIKTIYPGTTYHAYVEKDGYYGIGGNEWVSKQYVKFNQYIAVVTPVGNVNVYGSPSWNGEYKGEVQAGVGYTVYAEKDGWYLLSGSVWIDGQYVMIKKE